MIDDEYSSGGGIGLWGGQNADKFSNIFISPSAAYTPRDLAAAMDYCRYLYFKVPRYASSAKLIIAYFNNDINFEGKEVDEKISKYNDFLQNSFKIKKMILQAGMDYFAYGNAFIRINYPFTRNLIDRRFKNGEGVFRSYDVKTLYAKYFNRVKFNLNKLTYTIPDPENESKNIELEFIDLPNRQMEGCSYTIIDPRFMSIQNNSYSGSCRYIYKPEPWLVESLKNGDAFVANDIPLELLNVIKNGDAFLYNEGEIFHFAKNSISGVSRFGWGIPPMIENFPAIYQILIYMKHDEHVVRDELTPFRLMSLNQGLSVGDPTNLIDSASFVSAAQKIISTRRKNPDAMFAMPFNVSYQEFGANGKQLVTKDLHGYTTDEMLRSMGFPVDLMSFGLNIQITPFAARIFETYFADLYEMINDCERWASKSVRDWALQKPLSMSVKKPTFVDDLSKQALLSDLVARRELPRSMLFNSLGVGDPVEAASAAMKEDIQIEKERSKAEQQAQTEQAYMDSLMSETQNPQNGGAQGGGEIKTPTSIQSEAQEIAQRWIALLAQDRGTLMREQNNLRETDINLYALTMTFYNQMKNQARSDGLQQMKQQAAQG